MLMNDGATTPTTWMALTSSAAATGTAADPTEVSMNSRFLTNTGLSILGAFTVVASFAWAPATFSWLMLAAGIVAAGLSLGIVIRGRGTAQRTLDATIAGLAAWTIVASLVFAGTVVTWLGFASGAAFVGLALVGLTLHELSTERVVHSFEVRTSAAEPELAPVNG
jgi:hypothetical protein